jgi:hypothetical protein
VRVVILLLSLLGGFVSGCASEPPKRAEFESNNLILNLFGDDRELIRERIVAASEAVGPEGTLILDYAPRANLKRDEQSHGLTIPIADALEPLSEEAKSRIYLTRFAESYPWIRDSSMGWHRLADGRYEDEVTSTGNLDGKVFSAASIITLLNSCEDASLTLPRMNKVALQEGMLVNNGAGLCVGNALVNERVGKAGLNQLLADMNCKKVVSSINWEDWRKQGHPNGHIDMSVAFLSPNVAVIPKLDSSCKTEFVTGWDRLKMQLEAERVKVIEIPVALGCVHKDAIVRTYSNLVVLKDSILLAKFVPPTPELGEKFDFYNTQAVQIVQNAMDQDVIPRRRIVQFPIGQEIQGGSVHCMSLNLPSPIGHCSQAKLDGVLLQKVDEALEMSKNLNSKTCPEAHLMIRLLELMVDHVGNRSLEKASGGESIQISEPDHISLESALRQLNHNFILHCVKS